MHGVRRVKQTAEALTAKQEKEKAKLKTYLELEGRILDQRDREDYSSEALALTTQLLNINPEHATIWNYRRDILALGIFPTSEPEKVQQQLISDLEFTTKALRMYPKVYVIWTHRRWCLENTPLNPDGSHQWRTLAWTHEQALVEKMLNVDARNFHAWNYRRYILSQVPPSLQLSDEDELKYTTKKIESNFSNFSAWHQRSLVYKKLWQQDPDSRAAVLDSEFDLVRQALYIDPNDQSGWLYHRWLIGEGDDVATLEREIREIEQLLEIEKDSKWCLESLVQYNRLLLRHRSDGDKEAIVRTCEEMLETLERIDSKRCERYKSIRAELRQE